MGRTENPGVDAVWRARISIAKGRRLCEQTRALRLQAQGARTRIHALAVRAAYSAERAHLAAEWVACVAARPRLPRVTPPPPRPGARRAAILVLEAPREAVRL